MIIGRRKHNVPGLNTTSTADISFMLLIFFLVTTNMDVDKGLTRQLPPAEKQEERSVVAEDATLSLRITNDSRLLVDDEPMKVSKLRERVEDFVGRVGKRHLITIETDPQATYDAYFQVQNEVVAAYRVLRERISVRKFGRGYAKLSSAQREEVKAICPQRIAEQYGQAAGAQTAAKGGRP